MDSEFTVDLFDFENEQYQPHGVRLRVQPQTGRCRGDRLSPPRPSQARARWQRPIGLRGNHFARERNADGAPTGKRMAERPRRTGGSPGGMSAQTERGVAHDSSLKRPRELGRATPGTGPKCVTSRLDGKPTRDSLSLGRATSLCTYR